MHCLEFLQKIIPSEGIVTLAELCRRNEKAYWKHHKYRSLEAAATAAEVMDQAGQTVYHACSTYKKDRPTEFRTQENAGWQKSFWVDADADPENPQKYASKKDALQDLVRVCKELKLPLPTVVDSGGGLHLYWTLTEATTTPVWTPLAERFKARLQALGFKQDPSRTADSASVLRPVGTHNRKLAQARPVYVIKEGQDVTLEQFAAALDIAIPQPAATVADENDDLGGGIEYPPSSADRILQFCPTLKHIADLRGNVSEPLWHKMIGVIKHTTEGAQRCHEMSDGHPEYSELETDRKIDNWDTGPSTCASFRQTEGNRCEGCTQTCKSPIQLGYSDTAPAPKEFTSVPVQGFATGAPLAAVVNRTWPKGFKVENGMLCRAVKDSKKDDAPYSWVPFCSTLFFPIERIRSEDGTWALRLEMITYRKTRRRFLIPTQFLVEAQSLASELAKQEVLIFGRNGKEHAMKYLHDFLPLLNASGPEIITNPAFGWTDDGQGFILGGEQINLTTVTPALCSENIIKLGLHNGFGVSGSRDEWVNLVDKIYNRPGAEAYQFLFCVALASPLISLAGIDIFHGIPVALTGGSGLGKTTTCKVACSAFGDPRSMYTDASPEGGTINPLLLRAGVSRHLPLIFDEMTQRTTQELAGMLFNLSNGQGKLRLTPQGTIAGNMMRWDMFSFITGNMDITAMLATQDRVKSDATQMRCFEIPLPDDYNSRLFRDTNVKELVDTKLQNCYGHVGREYIRYIIRHKPKVVDMIFKLRSQFSPKDGDETRERFYMDTVVLAVVAGTIAYKLGILRFDMKVLMKWALNHVKSLRINRCAARYTNEEFVALMLASLHGRTLITATIPETRGGHYTPESPIEPLRDIVVARNVTRDRKFYLSAKYTNEWSRDNGVPHRVLVDTMDKLGLIKHPVKADPQGLFFFNLTQGSTIASAKSRCFELDYEVLVGTVGAESTKVVPLRTA